MALPTLQQAILQPLDVVRAVAGLLGLRQVVVTVTRRVWTGGRPGSPGAAFADTTVQLVNQAADGSLQQARVRQVSRAEAFASSGQYTNRDLKVGPVTPVFAATAFGAAGGFDDNSIDPAPSGSTVQMIWRLTAPGGTYGLPADGIVCEKRGEEATSLRYVVYLRATGRQPR